MKAKLIKFLAITTILGGLILLSYGVNTLTSKNALPQLQTDGRSIVRSDTGWPVLLRGAVSDYFRYGRFNQHLYELGLDFELSLVKKLKDAGANIIGLYLADSVRLKEEIEKLDTYIEFAKREKMYIYLIPVAREFNDMKNEGDASRNETFEDLENLLAFLSDRYSDQPHVLYGFGAEPTPNIISETYWHDLQVELAKTVRTNAPDSIILVTEAIYWDYSDYAEEPFPYENVVYFGNGYIREDNSVALSQSSIEERIDTLKNKEVSDNQPYILGEFGGNFMRDFSTDQDFILIEQILDMLEGRKLHYTMYKLSPNHDRDALSLYNKKGELTKRGELIIDSLRKYPPTRF